MSRIINPETGRKERDRMSKAVVKALRELMQKNETDQESFDLIAFMILGLQRVYETIDISVGAWEKRGYWLKADRYRRDWEWTSMAAKDLETALFAEDWVGITKISMMIAQKFSNIKISPRNRLGNPWVGAWEKLRKNVSIEN